MSGLPLIRCQKVSRSGFALVSTFMIRCQCGFTPDIPLHGSTLYSNFRMFPWKLWIWEAKINVRVQPPRSSNPTQTSVPMRVCSRIHIYNPIPLWFYTRHGVTRIYLVFEFQNIPLKIVDLRAKNHIQDQMTILNTFLWVCCFLQVTENAADPWQGPKSACCSSTTVWARKQGQGRKIKKDLLFVAQLQGADIPNKEIPNMPNVVLF